MNNDTWHLVLEASKLLIAPLMAILGYYLSGVNKSLKDLHVDVSEIKNSMGVNSEKVRNAQKDIEELKHKMDIHDQAFLDFYRSEKKYGKT